MPLAFVVPRYGEAVYAGAESAARRFAEELNARGRDTVVLTTCARDLQTWRNVEQPGLSLVNGVPVRRFPVLWGRREARQHRSLMRQISQGQPRSPEDEHAWIDSGPHSPLLYHHLLAQGHVYDLLIFVPYLFPITHYGSAIRPERTIIWPCLHDEPFARFRETRTMLNSSLGLMHNCEPEQEFTETLLGTHHPGSRTVGIGVTSGVGNAERFRQTYDISAPFLLYVGRLDPMKNLLELFDAFLAYRQYRRNPLKLVLVGDGPLSVPLHPDIVKLGALPESDKWDAYAASMLLCQPSLVESFSLTIMEAWLQGKPVLVHDHCDVTRYHVLKSQGGLYYAGPHEFACVLDWLFSHPRERHQLGMMGRQYVTREYNWVKAATRFERAVEEWMVLRRLRRLR